MAKYKYYDMMLAWIKGYNLECLGKNSHYWIDTDKPTCDEAENYESNI